MFVVYTVTQKVLFSWTRVYFILSLSAYYARVAGLSYGVNHTVSGFQVRCPTMWNLLAGSLDSCFVSVSFLVNLYFLVQVTLVGYNHKLRILLETVVEKIASFKVKSDRFAVIKVTLRLLVPTNLLSFEVYYMSILMVSVIGGPVSGLVSAYLNLFRTPFLLNCIGFIHMVISLTIIVSWKKKGQFMKRLGIWYLQWCL